MYHNYHCSRQIFSAPSRVGTKLGLPKMNTRWNDAKYDLLKMKPKWNGTKIGLCTTSCSELVLGHAISWSGKLRSGFEHHNSLTSAKKWNKETILLRSSFVWCVTSLQLTIHDTNFLINIPCLTQILVTYASELMQRRGQNNNETKSGFYLPVGISR